MTGSPIFSINLIIWKNPCNLNYHMSIKKSQAILKHFIDLKFIVRGLRCDQKTKPCFLFRHFVTLLLPTEGHLWNNLQKFNSDDVLLPWTGLCFWMDENLLQPFRSTWPRSCSDISSVCHLRGNRWWRVTVPDEIELPLIWSYIIHVNSIELDPHQSQCSLESLQLYGWPKNYLLWLEVDLGWHR